MLNKKSFEETERRDIFLYSRGFSRFFTSPQSLPFLIFLTNTILLQWNHLQHRNIQNLHDYINCNGTPSGCISRWVKSMILFIQRRIWWWSFPLDRRIDPSCVYPLSSSIPKSWWARVWQWQRFQPRLEWSWNQRNRKRRRIFSHRFLSSRPLELANREFRMSPSCWRKSRSGSNDTRNSKGTRDQRSSSNLVSCLAIRKSLGSCNSRLISRQTSGRRWRWMNSCCSLRSTVTSIAQMKFRFLFPRSHCQVQRRSRRNPRTSTMALYSSKTEFCCHCRCILKKRFIQFYLNIKNHANYALHWDENLKKSP